MTSITFDYPDVFFVNFNGLNGFIKYFLEQYIEISILIINNIDSFYNFSLALLIICACLLFFIGIAMSVLMIKTVYDKYLIITIFLLMPIQTI